LINSHANIIVLSSLKKPFICIIFLLPNFHLEGRGFFTLEDFKKAFNSVYSELSERFIVEAFR